MSNDSVGPPRSADLHSQLRLVALAAVVMGVVLLAAAAFVLSYEGIHQIALRAGVSPRVAKLYPMIFDAMLVIAAAAALALRGAGRWARFYAWASLVLVLVALAAGNVVYATGTALPAQPTRAAVAVTPWVLLVMAFGLLLAMLRYFRTARPAAGTAAAAAAASGSAGAGADVNGVPRAAVTGAAAARAGAPGGNNVHALPRVDLDTLLGPRAGESRAVEAPNGTGAGENSVHQADPVGYGEENGYVHPDSYLDEGEHSPHGDTGGPEAHTEQGGDTAGDGTHPAGDGATSAPAAETPATPAEATATPAETTATPAEATATPAEAPATPAEAPATPAETTATLAEAPATPAETTATPAEAPATPAETTATPAETTATPAETTATPAEAPATPVAATAPVAANGQAAGGDRAAMATPAAPNGTAEASQGGDGVAPAPDTEGPTLERIRSTPTRPEE